MARHTWGTLTALLALVLAAGLVLVAPVAPASAAGAKAYEKQAHQATNQVRANRGLVKLRQQACLNKAAKQQASKMARRGELFHQDLERVLQRCRLNRAGENVAYGYPTGRAVVKQGWMRSSGHRANILQPRYRLVGYGAVRKGGRWYVAQVFGARS